MNYFLSEKRTSNELLIKKAICKIWFRQLDRNSSSVYNNWKDSFQEFSCSKHKLFQDQWSLINHHMSKVWFINKISKFRNKMKYISHCIRNAWWISKIKMKIWLISLSNRSKIESWLRSYNFNRMNNQKWWK